MTETGNDEQTHQNDIYSRIYIFLADIRNSSLYQQAQYYARTYPVLAVAALIIGTLSFLPVLTFTLFVLATFIVSLLWFLVVEGALLTVAIVMLSGTLFTIGILGTAFTVCIGVSWYIVRKVHSIACFRQYVFSLNDRYNINNHCIKQEVENIPETESNYDSVRNVNV